MRPVIIPHHPPSASGLSTVLPIMSLRGPGSQSPGPQAALNGSHVPHRGRCQGGAPHRPSSCQQVRRDTHHHPNHCAHLDVVSKRHLKCENQVSEVEAEPENGTPNAFPLVLVFSQEHVSFQEPGGVTDGCSQAPGPE